jgi:hypothetical protein
VAVERNDLTISITASKTDLINYAYDRWEMIFARRCDINDETCSETVNKNIHVMHCCTWHGKWVLVTMS